MGDVAVNMVGGGAGISGHVVIGAKGVGVYGLEPSLEGVGMVGALHLEVADFGS